MGVIVCVHACVRACVNACVRRGSLDGWCMFGWCGRGGLGWIYMYVSVAFLIDSELVKVWVWVL